MSFAFQCFCCGHINLASASCVRPVFVGWRMCLYICVRLLKHISALHNEQDRNANDLVFMMTSATENVDGTDGESVRVA